MLKVTDSLNDISYRQVLRKLTNGIEQINSTKGKDTLILIDSHVSDTHKRPQLSTLCDTGHSPHQNDLDNLTNDESNTVIFDGIHWIHQDDGRWKPPDKLPDKTPHINVCNASPAQSDSGANRIVTDSLELLQDVVMIEPLPMGGCNKTDTAAIVCTAMGKLPLQSNTGTILLATAYYSAEVDGTIISPTTLVQQHADTYSGWMQHADCMNKNGYITLISKHGTDLTFNTVCSNDLWYHDKNTIGPKEPRIRKLNSAAQYELWHQRTAHAGTSALAELHKHVNGVPLLRGNTFYRCPSCMSGKLSTKRAIGKKTKVKSSSSATEPPPPDDDLTMPIASPGQHFHMDFGFVRGSDYSKKTKKGSTITSIDGKNSYLAIVDRATRYTWIFTTSSKHPPIQEVELILNKFKSTNPHRTVRVDQGGELGKSDAFKKMIGEQGFSLEITGSDASAQNGIVERPNRTFGQMMRCMLHAAELGPEFWSYALQHAVYIKNRLPHTTIKGTPYESFTGIKPDLQNFKIFGSKIYAKKPGKRPFKLDHHTASGYFLGYTATNKNIQYIDAQSGKVKTATHVIFDEAHMSNRSGTAPLAAQTLQRLGYYTREDWIDDIVNLETNSNTNLLVKQLSPTSIVPTRATDGSIGYDLAYDNSTPTLLAPGSLLAFTTGLAIKCPVGTYARIAPRSGLTFNHHVHTMAGVIDPDYRGQVKVLLHNFGDKPQLIKPGQRIAQLILERAHTPEVDLVEHLDDTTRGSDGFGSTDVQSTPPIVQDSYHDMELVKTFPPHAPSSPLHASTWQQYQADTNSAAAAASLHTDILSTFEPPYDLTLSSDIFDHRTHRIISIRKSEKDALLGMNLLDCPERNLPQLLDCHRGSSSIRIPRWRSELKNGYITHVNDIAVTDIADVKSHISKAIAHHEEEIKIGFATIDRQAMHPQYGIPQLYHDQLNIIGRHLWEIKNDPVWHTKVNEELVVFPTETAHIHALKSTNKKKLNMNKQWSELHSMPNWYKLNTVQPNRRRKLTRRKLLLQDDWTDWQKSEQKQLDQYHSQGTFSEPCPYPKGENVLPLLWTYLIKDCGTKKARCVCNGSPKQKGSVTLGDTYAGSLEQTGSRIFWASTALNNYITIGADASNAFAEAPAPKAPLFVTIDQPYREWYALRFPDKPPIPVGYVLPVNGALQGHPESARLWALLIDKIIRNLNLQPCTHEPCLYFTNDYNHTKKTVLFLRQVDDFAISCEDKATAMDVIAQINNKMTIVVKELGLIDRFNGVDVLQSRHFIKLYNKTYIEKILLRHQWIHDEPNHDHNFPLPMISDNAYQHRLETQDIPTEKEINDLEKKMGFGYRQAIGELIYALVTCRPDISYAVIKLSQYSTRPTEIHFEAIKNIYRYLNSTKEEGIHFWRTEPRLDLPDAPLPMTKRNTNYDEHIVPERQQAIADVMLAAADSDFAGDKSHRKSVSGIILMLAGGTIFYKTKYQDTIAMSSTEAEFTAAAEAGKYILYVRSILDQIGVSQQHATILFEDNQGALLMANAQQPTKRTRHMDIKHFSLQDWVKRDLIRLKRIATNDNYSDVMTKATGRVIFYRHVEYILGKHQPAYVLHPNGHSSIYTQDKINSIKPALSTGGYDNDIRVPNISGLPI